jgi:glycosyltransferase involved in cell wall biosynthesis
MNVLMVTSSYPKFPGDVTAPFIESIARGVAARGHAVDVVLPQHPELRRGADEPVRFFPYHYVPVDAWARWGYAQSLEADVRVRSSVLAIAPLVAWALRREIAARLLARRYDVVHAHWVVPNAVLVRGIVKAHGLPFVISLHGSDAYVAARSGWLGRLTRWSFDDAERVTACSDELRTRAVALGAEGPRTLTVPYGVDVHSFRPDRPTAGIRERLGVRADSFLVIAVGRLVEKKGFEYLIDAAARTGGVELAILGDGDLRASLSARAQQVGARVQFPGFLDREATASALAAADVVVVPSVVDSGGNVDGLPNTLLEAMAAGRPIVASRVAGIPDVIADERNGLLVPPKDPSALSAALRRLLREPETRERLARAAREHAVERLSWEATARRFEECYVQAAALAAR